MKKKLAWNYVELFLQSEFSKKKTLKFHYFEEKNKYLDFLKKLEKNKLFVAYLHMYYINLKIKLCQNLINMKLGSNISFQVSSFLVLILNLFDALKKL